MMKKFRERATCIVFYDFDPKLVDLKHWFYTSIELFEVMNIPLVYLGATAEDIKWQKVKTFKYGKKFIEKRGFDNLRSLTIQSDCPQEIPDSIERDASASIGISNRSYMTFYVNERTLKLDQVEKIVSVLAEIAQPKYGFVHQRDYQKGPVFYTWGIIVGLDSEKPEEKEERQRITKWNHQYQLSRGQYRTGLLREIYPLNLLSQTHLIEPVYETTLESWIKSSPDHGDLKPLTQNLWSWWVPEDKIQIVTQSLKNSGIIICI